MTKKIKPRFEQQQGFIVESLKFSADQKKHLSKILSKYTDKDQLDVVITSLQHACELGKSMHKERMEDVSPGERKAALVNISELSEKLAYAIENADIHTSFVLFDISYNKLKHLARLDWLGKILSIVADETAEAAENIKLTRKKIAPISPIGQIEHALIRNNLKISPSKNETSDFFQISYICFEAMGFDVSPSYAIDELIKLKKKISSLKKGEISDFP